MKKLLKVIMLLLGILLLLGIIFIGTIWHKTEEIDEKAGRNVEWSDEHGQTLRNLRYGEGTRNIYDLFLPKEKKSDALMLFIHGGSWMGGNKEDIEWAARHYAQEGFVTATINYSRLGNDKTAIENQHDEPSIISMLSEINMAIEAIKKECKELKHPLTQMAIGGYSAGGHLAMLYSSLYATSSPLPIRFQISWVGPTDFTLLFPTNAEAMEKLWNSNDEESKTKQNEYCKLMYALTGNMMTIKQYSAALEDSLKRAVSPLHNINKDMPPAVLAYGANDKLVSAHHGKLMSEALQEIGIENKLYVFPNSGHELGYDSEYTDSVHNTISDFCKRYFISRKNKD